MPHSLTPPVSSPASAGTTTLTNDAPRAPRGQGRRLLGIRVRYWRVALVCALMYWGILLAMGALKTGLLTREFPLITLVSLFFGAFMSAMFAYFEAKALTRINIDFDEAFDTNIFKPHQSRTLTVLGSRESVLRLAHDAMAEYGAIVDKHDDQAGTVSAITFQNWRSYGERLTIAVSGNDPCNVTVSAAPRMYLFRFVSNYGRSWEHVEALSVRLTTGVFPVAPAKTETAGPMCSGDANLPPAVMEAGAWQRLLSLSLLYSMMLLGLGQPGKFSYVLAGFLAGFGIEVIAYFRFRPLVRRKLRSESQETVELMLNNIWPAVFAPILLMDPRQGWDNGKNLAALGVVTLFAMMAINRWREKGRERLQRANLVASREKAELQRQLAEAKLIALSAQIEPHFLFNTLASIQYLIRNDAVKASEMTGDLIRYLRLALPRMKQSTARLADELDLVRAYLGIMQIRMGARLQFVIDSPGENADAEVPTMALITLVENAIKHGLEQKPDGGMIHVSVNAQDRHLKLEVADTGGGFSTAASGTGIGLTNIRERLATLYGDRASLELETNQPSGVKAILKLPMEKM